MSSPEESLWVSTHVAFSLPPDLGLIRVIGEPPKMCWYSLGILRSDNSAEKVSVWELKEMPGVSILISMMQI